MAYKWRKMNKIEKYEMVHEGALLYAITSEDLDVKANVTDLMITLSNKKAGKFFLFFVEKSEYKGWDDCTLVAIAENGVKRDREKQVINDSKKGYRGGMK